MQNTFKAYCGPKETTLDGKSFAKLIKDCKLIDKTFTATDVDLMFAKVKSVAGRRITSQQFDEALHLIAQKKKVTYDEIV
jgi:hypothetical protein